MDQKKTGYFLRELRKEKGITQEQLAEILNVSGRSVSRWETGNNMPDISLLVEIADFYDIDVRELIEGERKSEMMNSEVREVAVKMADYAGAEKEKHLGIVRILGITGVVSLTVALVLQCIKYEPDFKSFCSIIFSALALIGLTALTLYVNGVLQKVVKNKVFSTAVKILLGVMFAAGSYMTVVAVLLFSWAFFEKHSPEHVTEGIENYDKAAFVTENGDEFDSHLFLFPDDTDDIKNAEYSQLIKDGLLDTSGYVFLKAEYDRDDYEAEVKRLSGVECTVTYKDTRGNSGSHTEKVRYDEESYNYPAYVADDGFDYGYEYALLDDANNTIIYVALNFPDYDKLIKYSDYLKKDPGDYDIKGNSLENFTIYAYKFQYKTPGFNNDIWTEYEEPD